MSLCFDIVGGAGPGETAAILAALTRLVEEQALADAVPPQRPSPGRWVDSGRPAQVANPFTHRPSSGLEGWSAGPEDPAAGR